ncbi:Aminoacylase-1 [Trichinella britovi]|uniref:N-acyl-aliphatic-L-amino acid amidohydrolase n=2 Tax=Trichinella TaxID=6333 RepID=A0A0V1CHE3_TRIBR|nr:Aminoacylase-1 [Trichinella sp. T6]KRY11153.1 Aminoacylase-1 [Trichinella patagoniensis]KRY48694.1 Aminoacylase-1 [Trichinella britovi]KRZ93261.1 Aminoacylase-1 [Trichinella sp. T8]
MKYCDCVKRFQEYLQIKTVHPHPDYAKAVQYLHQIGESIPLKCEVFTVASGNLLLIMTLEGTEPSLPSILLNSHMDVVPAYEEKWKYDPFSGHMDEKGDIYGRGSQDMKNVGMQYLEAILHLKRQGKAFKRTIHLSFVPDEEMGGKLGMAKFIETDSFKKLNVGVCLDEGIATEDDVYRIYYAERNTWWIKLTCHGNPGHASKFIENTAAEKMKFLLDKFLNIRESEKARMKCNPSLTMGDLMTVNLTELSGGVQPNVVPSELTAVFDIRLPPTVDCERLKKEIDSWLIQAGGGIDLEFIEYGDNSYMSPTDANDKWWKAITEIFNERKMKYKAEIFTGATDARFLRSKLIPAYGFSPMIKTPVLLHDNDERLNKDVYLEGIRIYEQLIEALANVP